MKTNRNILWMFLITISICSCTYNYDDDEQPGLSLYSHPRSYPLNLSGYKVNPFTGDSVRPIINSFGDTVKTGVRIPFAGKVFPTDSASKPRISRAKIGRLTKTNSNMHKIPDNVSVIPVDKDKLEKVKVSKIKEGDSIHHVINSKGQKVPTGVKIVAKAKKVKAIHPQPKKGILPSLKDNAIADIKVLDEDHGMNSSYVRSILEDKDGNVWIGTWGGGVSVYNGETFVNYTMDEGLINNVILSIFEDKKGNLWFGTNGGGVCMYDGEYFYHYSENEGLGNNYILSILEDRKGKIWFATWGGGICVFDGFSFTHFTKKEGLADDVVLSLLEDKNGNLWFGTNGGGVTKYDGENFINYNESIGLSNNSVLSLMEDRKGNIWFGTWGSGLDIYNGESITHYSKEEGLSNDIVRSLFEDSNGEIWIGTGGGGVNHYDGEYFIHYSESEGLGNNYIWPIMEDKSGNLWFGTYGGGVNIINRKSFVHFTKNEGLSNDNVWSMLEDKNGNIWFATNGGGVNVYDGDSFIHFDEDDGLSSNSVLTMFEDRKGNIWFGTYGDGVCVYDGFQFKHYTKSEGLSHNVVWSILEDKTGKMWFGTWGGGISMFDGINFSHFTEREGLSSNDVRYIYEDKDSNIWFCSNQGGVSKYDGEYIFHYSEKEGLISNTVNSILEDNNGNLWIGTQGGVSILNGDKFISYTETEGLCNNNVQSILINNNRQPTTEVWLSTSRGIFELTFNNDQDGGLENNTLIEHLLNGNYKTNMFIKQDGLKGAYFNPNSALIDSRNRAWWGAGKAVEMLNLKNYKNADKKLKPILKQIDINENFIDYRNISDNIGKDIQYNEFQPFENYPLNLEVPYYKNHLTFHFIAIDWAAPHKIRYQYRMEGLSKKWSEVTSDTKADFRNLPYGTFTFKVRAIGESQIWSEPFEYTFTIHPPWWHTAWFRIIYISAIIILVYLVFRWRTASLRKQKYILERTVKSRTAEVVVEKMLVERQKHIIEEKHKEITDSINYAERIQRSFLATKELLDENLRNYFVLFQPKEAVSGDFYWASKLNNENFVIACADSTGHGVPGAIMSILNISSLEKSIETKTAPTEILNDTRKIIIERLKKDGSAEGGKDGMDCSLLSFDFKNNKLEFALANNPLWLIRNGEITEYKPDKMPVGKHDKQDMPFTNHEIEIQKGDSIFIFTDGYADQFGGPKGKKFKYSNLQKLLMEYHLESPEFLHTQLLTSFQDWRGDLEQVDDVCIIGIKI